MIKKMKTYFKTRWKQIIALILSGALAHLGYRFLSEFENTWIGVTTVVVACGFIVWGCKEP